MIAAPNRPPGATTPLTMQDCVWHHYSQQPCPRCGRTHYQQQTTINGTLCSGPIMFDPVSCNRSLQLPCQPACTGLPQQPIQVVVRCDNDNCFFKKNKKPTDLSTHEITGRRDAIIREAESGGKESESLHDALMRRRNGLQPESGERIRMAEDSDRPCGSNNNSCRHSEEYDSNGQPLCNPCRCRCLKITETSTSTSVGEMVNAEMMAVQRMSDKDVQIARRTNTKEYDPQTSETRMITASVLSKYAKNCSRFGQKPCHDKPVCTVCFMEPSQDRGRMEPGRLAPRESIRKSVLESQLYSGESSQRVERQLLHGHESQTMHVISYGPEPRVPSHVAVIGQRSEPTQALSHHVLLQPGEPTYLSSHTVAHPSSHPAVARQHSETSQVPSRLSVQPGDPIYPSSHVAAQAPSPVILSREQSDTSRHSVQPGEPAYLSSHMAAQVPSHAAVTRKLNEAAAQAPSRVAVLGHENEPAPTPSYIDEYRQQNRPPVVQASIQAQVIPEEQVMEASHVMDHHRRHSPGLLEAEQPLAPSETVDRTTSHQMKTMDATTSHGILAVDSIERLHKLAEESLQAGRMSSLPSRQVSFVGKREVIIEEAELEAEKAAMMEEEEESDGKPPEVEKKLYKTNEDWCAKCCQPQEKKKKCWNIFRKRKK